MYVSPFSPLRIRLGDVIISKKEEKEEEEHRFPEKMGRRRERLQFEGNSRAISPRGVCKKKERGEEGEK